MCVCVNNIFLYFHLLAEKHLQRIITTCRYYYPLWHRSRQNDNCTHRLFVCDCTIEQIYSRIRRRESYNCCIHARFVHCRRLWLPTRPPKWERSLGDERGKNRQRLFDVSGIVVLLLPLLQVVGVSDFKVVRRGKIRKNKVKHWLDWYQMAPTTVLLLRIAECHQTNGMLMTS